MASLSVMSHSQTGSSTPRRDQPRSVNTPASRTGVTGEKARRALYLAKKRLPKANLLQRPFSHDPPRTQSTVPEPQYSLPQEKRLRTGLLKKRPRYGKGDFGQPRLFLLTPSKLMYFHTAREVSDFSRDPL